MRRLIAGLVAILAVGCVLPAPRSAQVELRAGSLAPVARLGRWDGERFVAVAPSSLPPSHLRVVVHGWAPGWGRALREAPDLVAWRATDAEGRPFEPWMSALARSYGARVATEAALAMDAPPAQLTLFDAPDAAVVWVTGSQMQLAELLPSLSMGWGAGRTFVENYVSMVGQRYTSVRADVDGIVEIALAPPHGSFDYRGRHNYPMAFYERTSGTAFGLGWSPLTPGASAPAPGCWEQPFGEIALARGCAGL
jgi:hypothetical protein